MNAEQIRWAKYLFRKLAEECSELAVEASKCDLFTPFNEYNGETNISRLQTELTGLHAVLHELQEAGIPLVGANHVQLMEKKAFDLSYFYKLSNELNASAGHEEAPVGSKFWEAM